VRRVNHSVEYKAEDGANVNQAESYFSRLRRAEIGQHHRISGHLLHQYANEAAWREVFQFVPFGLRLSRLCLAVLRTAAGELLSTDDIADRVIAAKGFDSADVILRAAIRNQVGSIVKRLHRAEAIENVGAGRASKWKLIKPTQSVP
jgi:hypothetical protein